MAEGVGLRERCAGRWMSYRRVDLCLVPSPGGVGWWCLMGLCTVGIVLGVRVSARAEEGATGVLSHSLRQADTTLLQMDREQRLRDLFLVTPEEGLGHFEEMERQRNRRRFISHYRKIALRQVRSWSLDLFAREGSDGLSFADEGVEPGSGTWVTRTIDRLVNGTDVELGYGAGNGLSVTFGRDLDWRGPPWLVRSRVEVDPVGGEMTLDFELRRISVACAWTRDGETMFSWTIPF